MHQNIGYLYETLNKFDQAIQEYNAEIKINPGYAEAYNSLGIIYMDDKKDYEQALKMFGKALAVDPKYYFAMYNTGLLNEKQDLTGRAIEYYGKALEINPDYKPAQDAKKKLLEKTRDKKGK